MKKFLGFLAAAMLAGGIWMPGLASAQTYTISQDVIVQLQQQIQVMINQLNELSRRLQSLVIGPPPTPTIGVRLTRQLSEGMSGEDVRVLQQILASDPTIYPEGLVTGFYGPLTTAAVVRFQQRFGVSGDIEVGPNTFTRINQILQEGAGQSGVVPFGLLTMPNIVSRFISPPPPPAPDTAAPFISVLPATNLTGSSARITVGTSENTSTRVLYSASPITPDTETAQVVVSPTMSASHAYDLTGLAPNTVYYFLVVSTDAAGNVSTSSQQAFTTLGS